MFDRTLMLIDENTLKNIQNKKILLIGVGGVGGYALESLIRIGFKKITIIDNDTIDISNLNRQIISTRHNIGNKKTIEAEKRALSINPEAEIKSISMFVDSKNIDTIFNEEFDYIIDACDTITTKMLLIKKAQENNIKIISCMGTGNRFNPSEIKITTLDKTYNDPLAKVMRELLKKNKISLKIPVIWSRELPKKIKTRTPGSIILVPAAAGLHIAYYILNDIKKDNQ